MKEENKNTRVITEKDYEIVNAGPLTIDPSLKKPGMHYKFVADRGNDIRQEQRMGYDIVIDEDFQVGSVQAATSSRFGSAVTVQSKCGTLLVLMATPIENFEAIEKYKFKKQKENLAGINKAQGIPDEYQQFNGQSLNHISIKTNNNENG